MDSELLEFSNFKSYCQFDLFGTECSYYQLHTGTDMLSDAQRLDKIKVLKENGSLEKILMSHDIHTKHRLVSIKNVKLQILGIVLTKVLTTQPVARILLSY